MKEIILSNDQKQSLNKILQFLKSDKKVFTLSGFAGSGKTHLLKYLLDELDINYVLAAPTHKAKLVLSKFVKEECFTIHNLLKLSPQIEIENFDLRYLEFFQNFSKEVSCDIPRNGLVIVDEASMVNDDLYDLLIDKCDEVKSKVLFVGDVAQLRPVNNGKTSKVFDSKDITYLTEIHRQKKDNPLANLIFKARDTILTEEDFITSIDPKGSLFVYDQAKDFMQSSLDLVKQAVKEQDSYKCKILAYTNNRVQGFNNAVRKHGLNTDKEYIVGDILTCYDTFKGLYEYINSEDYFIDSIEKSSMTLPGTVITAKIFNLDLIDSEGEHQGTIPILSRDNSNDIFNKISGQIESFRMNALSKRKGTRAYSQSWGNFYRLNNSFFTPHNLFYGDRLIKKKSFDYGYAMTVHKSQGTSLDNVLLDVNNFKYCRDPEELRQLQYVGLSRTKNNIYILK